MYIVIKIKKEGREDVKLQEIQEKSCNRFPRETVAK